MTKVEKAWCDAITRIGCIVCWSLGLGFVPGAVHHILKNGRRQSHCHSICLCDPGHHQNAPKASGHISRHPFKTRFEQAYGTEAELLARTEQLVGDLTKVA